MGQRRFVAPPNNQITPCPKCGQNRDFFAKAMQVAEDYCEVWIECKCGFDPTELNTGYRVEDVWGSLDDGNIHCAISASWNDAIADGVHLNG